MHIHLDLVGGISGDMFIGALLDCFPEHIEQLGTVIGQAGFSKLVSFECEAVNDGILTGTQFIIAAGDDAEGHRHRHYSDIIKIISESNLDQATKEAALSIFRLIAEAEAKIHGKALDKVAFHEVGAWDSIADIVFSAWLIVHSRVSSWSVSKLPFGKGQVSTAHGRLPVPAPATSLLLEGFEFFDDDIEGERITPTGAAILKYLDPFRSLPAGSTLRGSGFGFGSKRFPGISNTLRCLVFENVISPGGDYTEPKPTWGKDQVLQLNFEIDDQSAESLATAIHKIRQLDGVLDVMQFTIAGKKGRLGTSIQVLATPEIEKSLLACCFDLTRTLGIRQQLVTRSILPRFHLNVRHNGSDYRVKIAERPGGPTAKVEMDDMVQESGQGGETLRHKVEQKALAQYGATDE